MQQERVQSEMHDAGQTLLSLFIAAPAGAAVISVSTTGSSLTSMPEAVMATYRGIAATPRIGPVLKTTIGLVLPVSVAALPPAILLVSAIGGMGYGFWEGCTAKRGGMLSGALHGITKSKDIARTFRKAIAEGLPEAVAWIEKESLVPLPPGEAPFDIPLVDGLRGIVAASLVSPVEALGLAAVAFRHTPGMLKAFLRIMWERRVDSAYLFVVQGAFSVVIIAAGGMAVPLVPAVSLAFSAGDTCVQGYRHGIRAALQKSVSRIKDFSTLCKDARKAK